MAQVIAEFAPVAVSGPGGGPWVWRVRSGRPIRTPGTAVLCQAAALAHACGSKAPPSGAPRMLCMRLARGRAPDLGNDLEHAGIGKPAFISAP